MLLLLVRTIQGAQDTYRDEGQLHNIYIMYINIFIDCGDVYNSLFMIFVIPGSLCTHVTRIITPPVSETNSRLAIMKAQPTTTTTPSGL